MDNNGGRIAIGVRSDRKVVKLRKVIAGAAWFCWKVVERIVEISVLVKERAGKTKITIIVMRQG
ncbi:hypothetical protein, partial [Bacillus thuringiensis]|uniref:hypothetical protein n=1 Tax=Bacillus thuringiensis TaxID=1428 RepID=UPI0011A9726D